MKMTKGSILYKVPKYRVRCISGHKWTLSLSLSFRRTKDAFKGNSVHHVLYPVADRSGPWGRTAEGDRRD